MATGKPPVAGEYVLRRKYEGVIKWLITGGAENA
jgi:hypothetical protein